MELKEFLVALSKHNSSQKGYQIHLNSGNLDQEKSNKHMEGFLCDWTSCFQICRVLPEVK